MCSRCYRNPSRGVWECSTCFRQVFHHWQSSCVACWRQEATDIKIPPRGQCAKRILRVPADRGDESSFAALLTSAPASFKKLTMSRCPSQEATRRGVTPSLSALFTSAPAPTRNLTMPMCPLPVARCLGACSGRGVRGCRIPHVAFNGVTPLLIFLSIFETYGRKN